jgi:spore maturation protein CgeB
MKIILAGVFNVPWSTNQFMKKHLERLGHQVLPFEIEWSHPRPLGLGERIRFKLGASVRVLFAGPRLLDLAKSQNPDAVIIVKGKRLDPVVTKKLARQTLTVYRYMDAPLHPYVAAHAAASHLTLVTGGHLVEPLARITGRNNVFRLLEGCDPEVHQPGAYDRDYACDVAFVGAPAPDRISLLRACQKAGHKIKVWGPPGWPKDIDYTGEYAYGEGLAKVCASAKIVLGVNSRNDCPGYFSDRAFLVLACRGFFLTHYVPELENYFEDHRHLAWFRDQAEMLSLIDKYLGDLSARSAVAAAGQALACQRYTWERSMRSMLEIMERQKR